MNRIIPMAAVVLFASPAVWCAVTAQSAPPADLQNRLDAARERLESAAREVAELSARLATESGHFGPAFHTPRASLGLQLDPQSEHAGARVLEVSPGGPAADAGVQAGDVITALDGVPLSGANPATQLLQRMRHVAPASTVKLRVTRAGKAHEFEVRTRSDYGFAFMPPMPPMPPMPAMPAMPDLHMLTRDLRVLTRDLGGLELASLTPELGSYFGTSHGVLVLRAPRTERLPVHDGDVILAIDGREPHDGEQAARILRSYRPGEHMELKVMRHGKPLTLATTLPEPASWPGMSPFPGARPHPEAAPPEPPAPAAPPGPPAAPGGDTA